jgi:hypothetical protein
LVLFSPGGSRPGSKNFLKTVPCLDHFSMLWPHSRGSPIVLDAQIPHLWKELALLFSAVYWIVGMPFEEQKLADC